MASAASRTVLLWTLGPTRRPFLPPRCGDRAWPPCPSPEVRKEPACASAGAPLGKGSTGTLDQTSCRQHTPTAHADSTRLRTEATSDVRNPLLLAATSALFPPMLTAPPLTRKSRAKDPRSLFQLRTITCEQVPGQDQGILMGGKVQREPRGREQGQDHRGHPDSTALPGLVPGAQRGHSGGRCGRGHVTETF